MRQIKKKEEKKVLIGMRLPERTVKQPLETCDFYDREGKF